MQFRLMPRFSAPRDCREWTSAPCEVIGRTTVGANRIRFVLRVHRLVDGVVRRMRVEPGANRLHRNRGLAGGSPPKSNSSSWSILT